MSYTLLRRAGVGAFLLLMVLVDNGYGQDGSFTQIRPTLALQTRGKKPKDLCLWIQPKPEKHYLSTVIVADPLSKRIGVYGLDGRPVQFQNGIKPGGIDVRYNFPFSGDKVDIVVFLNRYERSKWAQVMVMRVDPQTRKLIRIDNDAIFLGERWKSVPVVDNYAKPVKLKDGSPKMKKTKAYPGRSALGGCLYHDIKNNRFFYVVTFSSGRAIMFELKDDGKGRVKGVQMPWQQRMPSACRAATADDFLGKIYIAERRKGVWCFEADPKSERRGKLVCEHGKNGVTRDLEGLAVYNMHGGEGYLIATSEGSSSFFVFDRKTQEYVTRFAMRDGEDCEGVAVTNVHLTPRYRNGIFLCTTRVSGGRYKVVAVPWDTIASQVKPGLKVSNRWNPRDPK